MRFAVVEGGRYHAPARTYVEVEDVEAEARRRLKCAKVDEWRRREFLTAQPMPDDIKHFALQVQFAAQAISRLLPIPDDFDDDVYWPSLI